MPHHLIIPGQFSAWILTHRTRVLLVFALITVVAVAACWRVPVRVSLLEGLMPDQTQYQAYRQRASMLGGGSDDLLYVATREGQELFTPRVLNSIRAAAREMERLPEIDRVFSIADAPRLTPDVTLSAKETAARAVIRRRLAQGRVPDVKRTAVSLQRYWPAAASRQQGVDLPALRESMRKDPIAGRLLSRDATAHAMLVWLAGASRLHNRPASASRSKTCSAGTGSASGARFAPERWSCRIECSTS